MDATDAPTLVLAWAQEITGITSGYDWTATETNEPLPDIVVEVTEVESVARSTEFPFENLQQFGLVIFRIGLSVMVENQPERDAAESLRGYSNDLGRAIIIDPTLGGRVPAASPFFRQRFTPPFKVREDGTMGRELTMEIAVADRATALPEG